MRLTLMSALGGPRGYGSPEVEESLARVRALVDELGDAPELAPVRFGLLRFYLSRAEIVTALEFADRVLAAGERQGDDGLRIGRPRRRRGVPLLPRRVRPGHGAYRAVAGPLPAVATERLSSPRTASTSAWPRTATSRGSSP